MLFYITRESFVFPHFTDLDRYCVYCAYVCMRDSGMFLEKLWPWVVACSLSFACPGVVIITLVYTFVRVRFCCDYTPEFGTGMRSDNGGQDARQSLQTIHAKIYVRAFLKVACVVGG